MMDKEKHLFVFSAAWCGPCRMMKAHVWNDSSVQEKLEDFNSVKFIDVDDPKNRELAVAYRISTVPMIYIVDGKGQPIKAGSTMNVQQTINFLD